MGFLIKLDTNGTNPFILKKLIKDKLVDYIAMDIKAPFDEYENVTRRKVNIDDIKESADIINKGNTDYEFRTTVVEGLLTFDSFVKINDVFKRMKKIKRYYLQKFQKSKHIDKTFIDKKTFSDDEFLKLEKLFKNTTEFFMVR